MDGFKPRYSARELAREWHTKHAKPDHKKVIRVLSSLGIRQHTDTKGRGKWFWTSDIKKHAPKLFEWWKDKLHSNEMERLAKGEAA